MTFALHKKEFGNAVDGCAVGDGLIITHYGNALRVYDENLCFIAEKLLEDKITKVICFSKEAKSAFDAEAIKMTQNSYSDHQIDFRALPPDAKLQVSNELPYNEQYNKYKTKKCTFSNELLHKSFSSFEIQPCKPNDVRNKSQDDSSPFRTIERQSYMPNTIFEISEFDLKLTEDPNEENYNLLSKHQTFFSSYPCRQAESDSKFDEDVKIEKDIERNETFDNTRILQSKQKAFLDDKGIDRRKTHVSYPKNSHQACGFPPNQSNQGVYIICAILNDLKVIIYEYTDRNFKLIGLKYFGTLTRQENHNPILYDFNSSDYMVKKQNKIIQIDNMVFLCPSTHAFVIFSLEYGSTSMVTNLYEMFGLKGVLSFDIFSKKTDIENPINATTQHIENVSNPVLQKQYETGSVDEIKNDYSAFFEAKIEDTTLKDANSNSDDLFTSNIAKNEAHRQKDKMNSTVFGYNNKNDTLADKHFLTDFTAYFLDRENAKNTLHVINFSKDGKCDLVDKIEVDSCAYDFCVMQNYVVLFRRKCLTADVYFLRKNCQSEKSCSKDVYKSNNKLNLDSYSTNLSIHPDQQKNLTYLDDRILQKNNHHILTERDFLPEDDKLYLNTLYDSKYKYSLHIFSKTSTHVLGVIQLPFVNELNSFLKTEDSLFLCCSNGVFQISFIFKSNVYKNYRVNKLHNDYIDFAAYNDCMMAFGSTDTDFTIYNYKKLRLACDFEKNEDKLSKEQNDLSEKTIEVCKENNLLTEIGSSKRYRVKNDIITLQTLSADLPSQINLYPAANNYEQSDNHLKNSESLTSTVEFDFLHQSKVEHDTFVLYSFSKKRYLRNFSVSKLIQSKNVLIGVKNNTIYQFHNHLDMDVISKKSVSAFDHFFVYKDIICITGNFKTAFYRHKDGKFIQLNLISKSTDDKQNNGDTHLKEARNKPKRFMLNEKTRFFSHLYGSEIQILTNKIIYKGELCHTNQNMLKCSLGKLYLGEFLRCIGCLPNTVKILNQALNLDIANLIDCQDAPDQIKGVRFSPETSNMQKNNDKNSSTKKMDYTNNRDSESLYDVFGYSSFVEGIYTQCKDGHLYFITSLGELLNNMKYFFRFHTKNIANIDEELVGQEKAFDSRLQNIDLIHSTKETNIEEKVAVSNFAFDLQEDISSTTLDNNLNTSDSKIHCKSNRSCSENILLDQDKKDLQTNESSLQSALQRTKLLNENVNFSQYSNSFKHSIERFLQAVLPFYRKSMNNLEKFLSSHKQNTLLKDSSKLYAFYISSDVSCFTNSDENLYTMKGNVLHVFEKSSFQFSSIIKPNTKSDKFMYLAKERGFLYLQTFLKCQKLMLNMVVDWMIVFIRNSQVSAKCLNTSIPSLTIQLKEEYENKTDDDSIAIYNLLLCLEKVQSIHFSLICNNKETADINFIDNNKDSSKSSILPLADTENEREHNNFVENPEAKTEIGTNPKSSRASSAKNFAFNDNFAMNIYETSFDCLRTKKRMLQSVSLQSADLFVSKKSSQYYKKDISSLLYNEIEIFSGYLALRHNTMLCLYNIEKNFIYPLQFNPIKLTPFRKNFYRGRYDGKQCLYIFYDKVILIDRNSVYLHRLNINFLCITDDYFISKNQLCHYRGLKEVFVYNHLPVHEYNLNNATTESEISNNHSFVESNKFSGNITTTDESSLGPCTHITYNTADDVFCLVRESTEFCRVFHKDEYKKEKPEDQIKTEGAKNNTDSETGKAVDNEFCPFEQKTYEEFGDLDEIQPVKVFRIQLLDKNFATLDTITYGRGWYVTNAEFCLLNDTQKTELVDEKMHSMFFVVTLNLVLSEEELVRSKLSIYELKNIAVKQNAIQKNLHTTFDHQLKLQAQDCESPINVIPDKNISHIMDHQKCDLVNSDPLLSVLNKSSDGILEPSDTKISGTVNIQASKQMFSDDKSKFIGLNGIYQQEHQNKTKKAFKHCTTLPIKSNAFSFSTIRGNLIVIQGTRLLVYKYDRLDGLTAISFHDLNTAAVSIKVVKNFAVVGDVLNGIELYVFQSRPCKLTKLSTSQSVPNLHFATTLEFQKTTNEKDRRNINQKINRKSNLKVDQKKGQNAKTVHEMFLLVASQDQLLVLQYSPLNIVSQRGTQLITRLNAKIHEELLFCTESLLYSKNCLFKVIKSSASTKIGFKQRAYEELYRFINRKIPKLETLAKRIEYACVNLPTLEPLFFPNSLGLLWNLDLNSRIMICKTLRISLEELYNLLIVK